MSQHLQSQSPVMTAARQTMAAWSKVLESPNDIPTVYKGYFDKTFEKDQRFPYVLLTPSLDKFRRKTTEKLVCDTEDTIHIFERNWDRIAASSYPYRDICGVEMGIILLDSWLTISGKTSLGEAGITTIEFNTTSLRHFAAILNKLRSAPPLVDPVQFAVEKEKFDHLAEVNFKFMNYGRESLIPGETVLQVLLQPEIRKSLWSVFGKAFYKIISLAHLTVLTDRELILIRDSERGKASQVSRYGGVWQYLPLSCIESLTLSESSNHRLVLSIQCKPGRTIEKLFEISSRPELEQFCSRLRILIPSVHTIR